MIKRRWRLLCLVLFLLSIEFSSSSHADVKAIWTVDDGEKIKANDKAPSITKTSTTVSLFGMKNEVLAFQIVVQADTQGEKSVRLAMPSHKTEPIFELFQEDFVHIQERSHDLVWKSGSRAEPANMLGLVPDRLLPHTAALDIPKNLNQVFWVDLWIPPTQKAGHSIYTLTITSAKGCQAGCDIEIRLEVLDRTMPDKLQTRTMLWFSGGEDPDRSVLPRYFKNPSTTSSEKKQALRLAHYHLARKHRITLFAGNHQEPTQELYDLLSGEAYSSSKGYQGPGQGIGQDLLVLHAYGGELTKKEATSWLEYTKQFKDLLDLFVYVLDEPRQKDWKEVNRRTVVSKPVPSFVTTEFHPDLAPNIFAALASLYKEENAKAANEKGKKLWIYNGVRPFSGSFAIDDVAVATRVNPWIQYKHNIERWFYWEATYYFDFQGKRGNIDIAQDPLNFTNRQGDKINGDGMLMYPGQDLLFPQSSVGQDAPLSSIRLKNWRRGIQDVEYLVMATKAGFAKEVNTLVQAMLPATLDQVNEIDSVSWPEDGISWQNARRYLFDLLKERKSIISPDQIGKSNWSHQQQGLSRFFMAIMGALLFSVLILMVHFIRK